MDTHERFLHSLTREERQLVVVQKVLYEGSWTEMINDLLARKNGRPFVYKLNSRIDEDLARIERLRAYENENGVRLVDHVAAEESGT